MPEKILEKWRLEAKGAHGDPWVTHIIANPFRIGRKNDCELLLSSESISRLHAEIRLTDTGIWLKDCDSTNGTFVNFRRLTDEQQLNPGDVIHFAGFEFQVGQDKSSDDFGDRTVMENPYVKRLEQLIATKAVTPYFQPIVSLVDYSTMGFE